VFVDNRPFPMHGEEVSFSSRQNQVEVHFAAMSYRNPGLIRYRVRSRPDEPWRETKTPEFRFVELAPGKYRPEVAASLDGVRWSAEPASFSFTVRAPWYATGWALALFTVTVSASLFSAYRIRLAIYLRAERQRTRIAMDLHDEMGSGLGSIGVLSGVLRTEGLRPNDRDEVIDQIEQSAEELGMALADIVWSLRPRARTLGAVFERIETLARRLLPHPQVELQLRADPDHQGVVVSQPVCKNVLSIATEALHNAARHGKPDQVAITLVCAGSCWQLSVMDNGKGFERDDEHGTGLGLQSMQRRARDIGADFTLRSEPGAGTSLLVSFKPTARDRRIAGRISGKSRGTE
jgi:signal transduction histidine kinase